MDIFTKNVHESMVGLVAKIYAHPYLNQYSSSSIISSQDSHLFYCVGYNAALVFSIRKTTLYIIYPIIPTKSIYVPFL